MKINSEKLEGKEFILISEPFIIGEVYKTTKEVESVGDIDNITIRQAEDDGMTIFRHLPLINLYLIRGALYL